MSRKRLRSSDWQAVFHTSLTVWGGPVHWHCFSCLVRGFVRCTCIKVYFPMKHGVMNCFPFLFCYCIVLYFVYVYFLVCSVYASDYVYMFMYAWEERSSWSFVRCPLWTTICRAAANVSEIRTSIPECLRLCMACATGCIFLYRCCKSLHVFCFVIWLVSVFHVFDIP